MVNLSGSSPASLPCRHSGRWLGAFLLASWLLAATGLAQMPDYLRTALNRFSPTVPAGWAYTLSTTRNGQVLVERFDPARPPGGQWSLLQCFGRTPTTDELEKYAKSRPTADSGGPQSNFQKADIEPGSLQAVSEDGDQAEFLGGFRSEASGADKMLAHLNLRLIVSKQGAYVKKCVLELKEPYWPVLGVKMNQLRVETRFSAPTPGQPSLPEAQESHFSGRILLVSNEEKLQLVFSDFRQAR
jgi:hypothetical protein